MRLPSFRERVCGGRLHRNDDHSRIHRPRHNLPHRSLRNTLRRLRNTRRHLRSTRRLHNTLRHLHTILSLPDRIHLSHSIPRLRLPLHRRNIHQNPLPHHIRLLLLLRSILPDLLRLRILQILPRSIPRLRLSLHRRNIHQNPRNRRFNTHSRGNHPNPYVSYAGVLSLLSF